MKQCLSPIFSRIEARARMLSVVPLLVGHTSSRPHPWSLRCVPPLSRPAPSSLGNTYSWLISFGSYRSCSLRKEVGGRSIPGANRCTWPLAGRVLIGEVTEGQLRQGEESYKRRLNKLLYLSGWSEDLPRAKICLGLFYGSPEDAVRRERSSFFS